ncbi:MAG: Ig-like, group 2, partial [Parcubacteria group bacterium Gr01-1014_20]
MKKLLIGFGAVAIALVGASMFAAFEAHVVNVTARIENALSVPTTRITFGTVFPQEHLNKPLQVSLSQSFLDEDRVDDIEYFIRQKPKCAITEQDGTVLVGEAVAGHVFPGTAFVILSKTGITNTGSHASVITGNIGSSPITAAAMDGVFCSGPDEITGTIYGVDAAYVGSGDQSCFAGNPPLANKTLVDNAILTMEAEYTDIAGRAPVDFTELNAGNLGGQVLVPGIYKWSSDVIIPTNVTLSGGA